MLRRSNAGLYVLLAMLASISLAYYVAGALALREEFFHSDRYAREPFEFNDDGTTLKDLRPEATAAGLKDGQTLLTVNGAPFTGYAAFHDLVQRAHPGELVTVRVRSQQDAIAEAHLRLAPREGPHFSLRVYIAFLTPVLGIPLFALLVGYWVVALRPRDLNAWLVLVLLAFPETAYGNLDFNFWPSPWYVVLGLWNLCVQLFVFPALVWFGFLFPEPWRLDRRLPWIKYVVLALTAGIVLLAVWTRWAQYFRVAAVAPLLRFQARIDTAGGWIQIISVLLFLAALFDKLRTAGPGDTRRRLRVLAVGSGLSLGPVLVTFVVVPWFGGDPHHGRWFLILIPCVALFPLTLAYVLIVQRAMDLRILLRMGTKYLLARATLVIFKIAVGALLVMVFLVPLIERRPHMLFNGVMLLICASVLFRLLLMRGSLGQRLEQWMDRRFFREAYDSEVILSELSEQVRQLADSPTMVAMVLRKISEVLHVPHVAMLTRSAGSFAVEQALGVEATERWAFAENSATVMNLVRTNQPATVYRDRPEAWFEEAGAEEQALLHAMHTELLLPMPGRARLIGLLALGAKRSEEPYTPADLRTLQSVAAQTGLSLEIAELVSSLAEQAAHRERVQREIEIAREVQQRLFPQTIPSVRGISLAGHCRPALEVGGDYYDLMELPGGALGFAIGDVSGKGISASLIMASLRASLRGQLLDPPHDLAVVIERVNRLVYEASTSSRYATFFFAVYEPGSRLFRYVNAGHNPPLLLQARTGAALALETSGPVVGMLPMVAYEAFELTLEPGDTLIGYTDGISEAMTVDDEEWGEERMVAAACCEPGVSAEVVLEKVFAAADRFTAGAKQHDDMTLLILKVAAAF